MQPNLLARLNICCGYPIHLTISSLKFIILYIFKKKEQQKLIKLTIVKLCHPVDRLYSICIFIYLILNCQNFYSFLKKDFFCKKKESFVTLSFLATTLTIGKDICARLISLYQALLTLHARRYKILLSLAPVSRIFIFLNRYDYIFTMELIFCLFFLSCYIILKSNQFMHWELNF